MGAGIHGAGILPLTRVHLGGGGGVSYDADATTLFAAMSVQPDSTRKGLINTAIVALKAAGIWTLLDWMVMLAAHNATDALLNWKAPGTRNALAVNAPTFTTDRGYAGNGSTSYLNTQFVPSTHGVQLVLNNASIGHYSRTNSDSTAVDIGARASTTTRQLRIAPRNGNTVTYGVNQGASSTPSNSDSRGLFAVQRTGASATGAFRNGASIGADTVASQGLTEYALSICAINTSDTRALFSTREIAFAFVGASMSAQQQADLYTAVQAYMTAIGAQV